MVAREQKHFAAWPVAGFVILMSAVACSISVVGRQVVLAHIWGRRQMPTILSEDAFESQNQEQWQFSCTGVWRGRFPMKVPPRVNFVVAHCKRNLHDVLKLIGQLQAMGVTVGSIDIYSKCGQEPDVQPMGSVVHRLPNIGGNYHAYAYHMVNLSSRKDLASDDVIVFIKDTPFIQPQSHVAGCVHEAIMMAAGPVGFGCFADPMASISVFAKTSAFVDDGVMPNDARYPSIKSSPAFDSPYRNFKSWLSEALSVDLPTPVTPVCYGGNFVTSVKNIIKNAHVWPALTQSLERAIWIEEGHFAERSWAGLLMDVSKIDLERVLCATRMVHDWYEQAGYRGVLQSCDSSNCKD